VKFLPVIALETVIAGLECAFVQAIHGISRILGHALMDCNVRATPITMELIAKSSFHALRIQSTTHAKMEALARLSMMIILAIAMAPDMMALIALTMHALHRLATMAAHVSPAKPPPSSAANVQNITLAKSAMNIITVLPCHACTEEYAVTERQPSIAIALELDL